MRPIRRILVAIKDLETRRSHALTKAVQLAKAFGARLELFHGLAAPVYLRKPIVSGDEIPDMEHSLRSRALARLDRIAARLRQHDIEVTSAVEWDFPVYEAIVRRAQKVKADLILADQHSGRHTVAGLLHLTDWELLRLSPVPVLLVKTPGTYRHPVILAALDPRHKFAKPAGLDKRILRASAIFSRALRGTQHALHAYVPLPIVTDPEMMLSQENVERLKEEIATAARKALDRELRTSRIPSGRRHLVSRHPADAIAQTARELHSSIVVMGAVSRSGLKRLIIGNTAERTLDLLACDVLIVKPQRFANRVPLRRRGARVIPLESTWVPL